MYEEITQKILDILKEDDTLEKAVKGWYFGTHDIRSVNTVFPFIDVKWRGGLVKKLKTGSIIITRRNITFFVRCVDKAVSENLAEKSVMVLTERIETVLDANESLGDLVETSTITEVLSDRVPFANYSIVGSLTQLETRK